MKAILARKYGSPDVLTLEEVDQPTPEGNQVLVRIHAAATNPSYWHRMEGKISMLRQMYGDPQPTDPTMGGDCAGTIVAIGKDVTRFVVGDVVFGAAKGAFAEYAIASEKNLVHKPENSLLWMQLPSPREVLQLCKGYVTTGKLHRISAF